jgi:hypothetical protein
MAIFLSILREWLVVWLHDGNLLMRSVSFIQVECADEVECAPEQLADGALFLAECLS